jgi:hypothetical protein
LLPALLLEPVLQKLRVQKILILAAQRIQPRRSPPVA